MISSKQQLARRKFLKLSGAATLGATLLPDFIFATTDSPTAKIALQLYTVRNEIEKDMPGTLRRLGAIGLENVETAFWPKNTTLQEAAKNLKDAGLKVCSCHIDIPVGDKKEIMLQTAEAFNCKKMIWHGWPEDKRYSSLDGTKKLIEIYNEAGQFAKANGLEFGLHNHWWEYRNRVGDRFVYEWLLEGVSPDIFFEIDTYWVKVAGQDPAKIVAKFGKRAPLLHIKDGPARWNDSLPKDNPDPMVAAGKGAQNFPAIVNAAKGNTKWMIIEMDVVATDVYQAIQDSYDYLVKNNFGIGKKI
jgi:sugar phosphate isomerase/epimerase